MSDSEYIEFSPCFNRCIFFTNILKTMLKEPLDIEDPSFNTVLWQDIWLEVKETVMHLDDPRQHVLNPMNIAFIKHLVDEHLYDSIDEFEDDMETAFLDCYRFSYRIAREEEREEDMAEMMRKVKEMREIFENGMLDRPDEDHENVQLNQERDDDLYRSIHLFNKLVPLRDLIKSEDEHDKDKDEKDTDKDEKNEDTDEKEEMEIE